ncbi:MAG: AAA family ATPase [Bacilli bacterium]|nr:AAA family ATPase [Bacilli bacterium]
MLLKFRFKNFKSFKELQEFSMISGNTKSYDDRLMKMDAFSVLKFSAIYGANGSGKSNLIDALNTMQNLICEGIPKYVTPISFKLDKESRKKPTYFETFLLINKKVYSYGFEFDSFLNSISSEWLTLVEGKKETDIFVRNILDKDFDYDKSLNTLTQSKMKMYLEELKEDNTKLFLSFINGNKKSIILEKNEDIKSVFEWFQDCLTIAQPDSVITSGDYLDVSGKIKQLGELLNAFGTGINCIGSIKVDNETAFQNIPNKIIESMREKIEEIRTSETKPIKKFVALLRSKTALWKIIIENEQMSFEKICFFHDKNKEYPFLLNEESAGTIRLFDIAGTLLTEKDNQLFVIDELDRKLHPQLTCKFVGIFLEKAKHSTNQLIISTHESRLLDFNILRRDEVWFSDKDKYGESKIYSLEEFNVRFDKKIDKAYLDGRYGGVPIFDSIFPCVKKCQE